MSDVIYSDRQADRHPLHDPRVRLHIEDGRYFLQTTGQRFDLITGEPPPPRTPGAVNIYTREYFELIRARLAAGGMTTYWLPVARPEPGADVNTIIRAFCEVFDDCSLWNATPFDLMLVGSRQPAGPSVEPVSESAFRGPWSGAALSAHLSEIGFELPEQIGATFVGDAPYLRQLTVATPPLTDDFPERLRPLPSRPSLSDPRYGIDPAVAAQYERVLDPARARAAFASSSLIRRLWPPGLIDQTLPFFEEQRMINRVLWDGGKPLRLVDDLHAVLTRTSLRTLPLWMLGSDAVKQAVAAGGNDGTGNVEYLRGLQLLVSRDYGSAASYFSLAERGGLRIPALRPMLAYALCLAGRLDLADRIATSVAVRDEDERHFWAWMARTFGVGKAGPEQPADPSQNSR
jgi:hypothetical protein